MDRWMPAVSGSAAKLDWSDPATEQITLNVIKRLTV